MQGFSLWACVLQEAGAPSAAGAGQSWPAEAPVTAVVNVGDYHGYQRLEALTVRGRAEGCPLPALSHMAASASPGRFLLGNIRAWTTEVLCQVQLIYPLSVAKCLGTFWGPCPEHIQCKGGRAGHLGPALTLLSLGRTEEKETLDGSSGDSESEERSSWRGRWRIQHRFLRTEG